MAGPAHKDPQVISIATVVLQDLQELCRSLVTGALLTDDGFEVVSLPGGVAAAGRIASMASAMQALSDAVVREIDFGSSEYLIIAAERGYVIQLRVPGHSLVFSTMFSDSETLGKALSLSRQAATKMAGLLAAAEL